MENAKYSLRQIVDMTGITEFTLRGWELRYNAFEPGRTTTGRRQYSSKDLRKVMLLRELVKRDHRIGDIARLKVNELENLLNHEADSLECSSQGGAIKPGIQEVMKFVSLQEWEKLEKEISKSVNSTTPLVAIREFIIPIFEIMGGEVAKNRLSIAQEHILSSMLKQQLYILAQPSKKPSKAKILIATPEGDFHELGILSAHAMASQMGLRSLYLGPNSPKKDLCETALRLGATHLLIASTLSKKEGAKEDIYSFVNFLDQNLPEGICFWLAGRASGPIHLKRNALQLTSLIELERQLMTMAQGRRRSA